MISEARPNHARERALLLGAIALGLMLRLIMGWQAPLWLDETYTAVIAGQDTATDLYGWMRRELSGPVFYLVAWLVAQVAGLSDFALRLPSVLFALAAVLLVAWRGHEDARLRLVWAALLALWLPGIFQASQARPQALLLFLAVIQAIAFYRAWRAGGARWTWVWAGATALMLLTHVYAAVPGGLQFLALSWSVRHRWRAHAPAIAAFVPVVGWYATQIPFYMSFARPGVASYPVLQPGDVIDFAPDLLGGTPVLAGVTLTLAAGITFMAFQERPRAADGSLNLSGEAVLALCGLAAALMIFSVGMIRPSYVPRYMVPCVPAALLGIARALMLAQGDWCRASNFTIVLAIFQAILLGALAFPKSQQREIYPLEFQQASDWLMRGGSDRPVIFTWDYPVAAINPDANLVEVGGFFFERAGHPRQVIVQRPPSGESSARPLADAARRYRADLIWIGDRKWPKALMRAEGLECRLWHRKEHSKSIACRYLAKRRPY
jgi:hypothetical protein